MIKQYGNEPLDLGFVDFKANEMMAYLYLPIKMSKAENALHDDRDRLLRLPDNLIDYVGIIASATSNAAHHIGYEEFIDNYYVYITAKTLWVEPGCPGNRPGFHVDGYGSNGDLSYIWYDMNPTEFAIQQFTDIPDDDIQSLAAMEAQTDVDNLITYPCKHLLRLDESVVHRVGPVEQSGYRTFIKISVSKHRYNLKMNSHNHEFCYDWNLTDRDDIRNCDNKDFTKPRVG